MKAAVRDRYGSPEVVELRDVERPAPANDQVLVRIRAASVNRADLDGGTSLPIFAAMIVGPLISLASDKWTGLALWWKPFHAGK
jgi:hypothetical protein